MLKRKIVCSVLAFTLLILCGCSGKDSVLNDDSTMPSEEDRIVYHTQQGSLTDGNHTDTVSIYTGITDKTDVATDVFMEAKVDGKILTYELGNWDPHVLSNGNLFLEDLNADGTDEIVLFMEVTGNGGALAQIFTIQKEAISLLYDLNDLDLGVTTIYQDGFKMLLENKAVGFSEVIDISMEYGPEHFDENGRFTGTSQLFLDPINSGTVKSASGSDLPQIISKRYVYLTNCLGELQTVFQYDSKTESLILVSMDFRKAGDNSVVPSE